MSESEARGDSSAGARWQRAVLVLLVLVLVVGGAQVVLRLRGGAAGGAVLGGIGGIVLGCVLIGGAVFWARQHPELSERGQKLLAVLAVFGACVGVLAPTLVGWRRPEPEPPAAAPSSPKLRIEGRRALSEAFGFVLTVPEPWNPLPMPPQPGLDAAFRHPDGAVLIVYGLPVAERDTVEDTLKMMLEQRRRQFPVVEDVVWGEQKFPLLATRSVAFSVTTPNESSRTRLWLAKQEHFIVGFNCSGPTASFARIESECQAALRNMSPLR